MMHFQTSLFIVVTIYIHMVYSKDLTLSKVSPPYRCGNDLKLKCQYSGTSSCCSLGTRAWRRNGDLIMSNGVETPATGKYTETVVANEKYFELTIKNIEASDFGKDYMCVYVFNTSLILTSDGNQFFCRPCWKCGFICWGWSLLGTALGNSLMLAGIFVLILDFDEMDSEDDTSIKMIKDHDDSRTYTCESVFFLFLEVIHTSEELKRIKGLLEDAAKIVVASLVSSLLITVAVGTYTCICYDFTDEAYEEHPSPGFIALGYLFVALILLILSCSKKYKELKCDDVLFLIAVLLFSYLALFGYAVYICLKKKKTCQVIVCILILVVLTQGLILLILLVPLLPLLPHIDKLIKASIGGIVSLPCPYKDASGQITWIKFTGNNKEKYSEGTTISQDLPQNLRERLKVDGQDLHISNVQASDTGIYECVFTPKPNKVPQVSKLELIVSGGGKNQSVESGSSCWPICRVGQDPNTSSSGPEKVRRSPEKERVDIKQDKKPTKVVRPQPSRPLPPMHLKTDNTGRAEYSTETEIFKPPALPSINKASDSPRPLPQKPPGTQLDPLSDFTSEKKKKKKRKKKEPKQSDEEN